MKKPAVTWIRRELVISPFCIGLCLKEEAFQKELNRLGVPRKDWPPWVKAGKDGQVHYFEKKAGHEICCIVCIKGHKGRLRVETSGLLIHEAVHVWQYIREELNEFDPSREFEAYSIQNIAQQLITAATEKKKDTK